jgi:hypothetical protein
VNKITEDMTVVDTISTDLATLLVGPEEKEMVVEAWNLPEGTREGDWLKVLENGGFEVMPRFTEERKRAVRSKLDMLRQNHP